MGCSKRMNQEKRQAILSVFFAAGSSGAPMVYGSTVPTMTPSAVAAAVGRPGSAPQLGGGVGALSFTFDDPAMLASTSNMTLAHPKPQQPLMSILNASAGASSALSSSSSSRDARSLSSFSSHSRASHSPSPIAKQEMPVASPGIPQAPVGMSLASSSTTSMATLTPRGTASTSLPTRGRQDSSAMQDVRSYLEWRVHMRQHAASERARERDCDRSVKSTSSSSSSSSSLRMDFPFFDSHSIVPPSGSRLDSRSSLSRQHSRSASPPSSLAASIAPWTPHTSVRARCSSDGTKPVDTGFSASGSYNTRSSSTSRFERQNSPQRNRSLLPHGSVCRSSTTRFSSGTSSSQLTHSMENLAIAPSSSPAPQGSLMSAIEASRCDPLASPPPPPLPPPELLPPSMLSGGATRRDRRRLVDAIPPPPDLMPPAPSTGARKYQSSMLHKDRSVRLSGVVQPPKHRLLSTGSKYQPTRSSSTLSTLHRHRSRRQPFDPSLIFPPPPESEEESAPPPDDRTNVEEVAVRRERSRS